MDVQLNSVAAIRMGVTFRGRDAVRPVSGGACRLIRIGDLSRDGGLVPEELLEFDPSDPIRADQFLRRGDVLLPNRGLRSAAYAFELPFENVVAGAQFFVLRPDPKRVLPAYLAWYLRGEIAAQHFRLHRKGTLVQTLQRHDIASLLVPVPPVSRQATIVAVDSLAAREREISARLAELHALLRQRTLLHAANEVS